MQLRPYLSPEFSANAFTDAAIDIAPTQPGVYMLYCTGRLVYIGIALAGSGIREELRAHRRGAYGECTRHSTAFDYEVSTTPLETHREYLQLHRERYGGRLPPCQRPG